MIPASEMFSMGTGHTMNSDISILSHIPITVFSGSFQDETVITWISDQIEKLTGYLPSYFIGTGVVLESLILEGDREHRQERIKDSIRLKQPYLAEYRIKTRDGSIRWVSEHGQTVQEEGGTLLTGALCDVSERKEIEICRTERADLFIKAFDAVPEMIAIMDTEHRILEMNKMMADHLGCSARDCRGDFCYTHIHNTSTFPDFCPHARTIADGKIHTEEVSDSALSGVFQVTTAPIFDDDGKVCSCIHIAHDISEYKKQKQRLLDYSEELEVMNRNLTETQEELSRFTTLLEGKVLEQTVALNNLSEEILERNRMVEILLKEKDQFINHLAHDLRTPLTPVIALLPTLREQISDPHLLEIIRLFEARIGYLREMVEEVIRYSHLNSQAYIDDYGYFDLKDIVENTFDTCESLAIEKNVRLIHSVQEGVSLMLSISQAPLLFQNLITNAIQYNKKGGVVTVGAHVHADWVTISIVDTGMGIPADLLGIMWEVFTTGDSSRSDPHLKGMGLPIVKRIVTMHRGFITASSPGEGRGATFTIILPLQPQK